ncbi:hypothetical protein JOE56_002151 [Brevibacterium paucivorans]|uniref:Uncharacterized protein n=1 Tax=Brevibacterium paucivorans TaxID=170994 RepID=A0ABS2SMF1_9MICO|nr:hypothetical protein [Brevibacterium paucivorans]
MKPGLSRLLACVGIVLLAVVWYLVGWMLASGFPHYGPLICATIGTCSYFLWSWKYTPGLALVLTGVTALVTTSVGLIAMNPIPFSAT